MSAAITLVYGALTAIYCILLLAEQGWEIMRRR